MGTRVVAAMLGLSSLAAAATWTWTWPAPTGADLLDVDVAVDGATWAVGAWGTALLRDEEAWRAVPTPTTADLHGVWVAGGDAAWAVGDRGTILRWDGARWIAEPSPTDRDLLVVAGRGDEVWAAGEWGTVLVRREGRWRALPRAEVQSIRESEDEAPARGPWIAFTALWIAGPRDVWVGGSEEQADQPGALFHWDGVRLAEVPWEAYGVQALAGERPDTGWALADGGELWAWDGRAWTKRADLPGFGNHIGDVETADFVLEGGALAVSSEEAGAFRWAADSGVDAVLPQGRGWNAVAGGWVVGDHGRVVRLGGSPAEPVRVRAVGGSGPMDVWAVGEGGAIFRWEGGAWTSVPSPTQGALSGVAALSPTAAWAVGEEGLFAWDGVGWAAVPSLRGLVDVVACAPGDVWALAPDGALLHRDEAGAWDVRDVTLGEPVEELACGGAGEVWVRSRRGGVALASAAGMSTVIAAPNPLYGAPSMTAPAPGELWACHLGRCQRAQAGVLVPAEDVPFGLLAAGPGEAWSVREREVARFDGARWAKERAPTPALSQFADAVDVYAPGGGELWVVTRAGAVLHRSP